MNNHKIPNGQKGKVIARIVEKITRKKKDGKPFWILKLSIRRSLTELYFKLVEKKEYTLKSNEKPLYVFSEKGRFVNTLLEGNDYLFEFQKNEHNNQEYFHAEEWEKLGDDNKLIDRAWKVILNKGEEVKAEEEKLSNAELLTELEKRIKSGEIIIEKDKEKFPVSAGGQIIPIEKEFATDLKDKESKKRMSLTKEED